MFSPYLPGDMSAAYKEMLTVTNAAKLLTAATYRPASTSGQPPAVYALITVNSNSISWWSTGDVPTASDGMITLAGGSFWLAQPDFAKFQMIRAGASDAAVAVQYFIPTR